MSLTSNIGNDELPLIAVFGYRTTTAAIEAGLTVNVMAPSPEAPSMAKAIELFLAKVKAGQTVEPVKLSGTKKSEEFLKAQEAKPQKKARIRKPAANSTPVKTNGKHAPERSAVSAGSGPAPLKKPVAGNNTKAV